MMLLRLTCFGLLVLMEMPTPNLAGNLSRQRLVYREIPVAEARRGMSKNIRARKAKQTDLHSTGNSSSMNTKYTQVYYIIPDKVEIFLRRAELKLALLVITFV